MRLRMSFNVVSSEAILAYFTKNAISFTIDKALRLSVCYSYTYGEPVSGKVGTTRAYLPTEYRSDTRRGGRNSDRSSSTAFSDIEVQKSVRVYSTIRRVDLHATLAPDPTIFAACWVRRSH